MVRRGRLGPLLSLSLSPPPLGAAAREPWQKSAGLEEDGGPSGLEDEGGFSLSPDTERSARFLFSGARGSSPISPIEFGYF